MYLLILQDNGFGPLITQNGKVIDSEPEKINVKVGDKVTRVAFNDLELLPQHLPQTSSHHHDNESPTSSHHHNNESEHYGSSDGTQVRAGPWTVVLSLYYLFKYIFNII